MKKFIDFFKKLIRNDNFLKVISVLLAIVVWAWIISTAKPTNQKEFQNIPVQLNYEGSLPDKQGLMMLLADQTIYVNLTLSGPRSNLFSFSEDNIKAVLNLSAVAAAGTYQLPISVTLSDENVKVDTVSPQIMNISFAKKISREIPITTEQNDAPDNIEVVSSAFDSKSVTVTGPEETVNSIQTARAEFSSTAEVPQQCRIELLDSNNIEVDRTYLSLSQEEISATELILKRNVSLAANITDKTGLPLSSIYTATITPASVDLQGSYSSLAQIEKLVIGSLSVDLSVLADKAVFNVDPPVLPEGVSYVSVPAITVTVTPPVQ